MYHIPQSQEGVFMFGLIKQNIKTNMVLLAEIFITQNLIGYFKIVDVWRWGYRE